MKSKWSMLRDLLNGIPARPLTTKTLLELMDYVDLECERLDRIEQMQEDRRINECLDPNG